MPSPSASARIGQSQDALFRDSLEQPHADGSGRYARRNHHVRTQRAKGRVRNRVRGLPQRIRSPVRVLTGDIFIADADAPLGKHAEDGAVLQLSAIDRLVNGAGRPRNAEPQQKASLRVIVVVRRLCPAVVAVAGGTGERVEGWAEAVARSRGGGRGDPVLIEETVPHLERAALLIGEIAGGQLERVAPGAHRGSLSAEHLIEQEFRVGLPVLRARGNQDGQQRRSQPPRSPHSPMPPIVVPR